MLKEIKCDLRILYPVKLIFSKGYKELKNGVSIWKKSYTFKTLLIILVVEILVIDQYFEIAMYNLK